MIGRKKNKTQPQAVTVGLIQMSASSNLKKNLAEAADRIEKAARKGAQIICLQELFGTQYFPQEEAQKNFNFAESIPGLTTNQLSEIAKLHEIVLIAPVFEKTASGTYYNSAVVIDADGSLLGTYRKMHIPEDPYFYEKYYFKPGNLGFKMFQTQYAKIGVLICWDQWFPEAARLTVLQGADILFYPTAIGWDIGRKDNEILKEKSAWKMIQRSHAIANGVYVACANRVGVEGKLHFWGSSFISDPLGALIAQASEKDEEIVVAELDLSKIEETRKNWPFLRDRRVNAYRDWGQSRKGHAYEQHSY